MSSETKQFHIGDILTVMTGVMISPKGVGGIYEICDWMTGEANFTHQLPRVSRECEPFLREIFPDLATVEIEPGVINTAEKAEEFFARLGMGTHRDVPKLPKGDHTSIDPITEFKMMRPDAEIIAVVTGDER